MPSDQLRCEWSAGPLAALKDQLQRYPRVLVAFSGGIDSMFLLHCCVEVLGVAQVLAVTAASETYTPDELRQAKEFAARLGVRHVVLETEELNDPRFAENPADRCYYCKHWFYKDAAALAKTENIPVILDGTNADDLDDYRPGRDAAREFGVVSPLVEAGITKAQIRAWARTFGLPAWNKPANPCLASRIPYGSEITIPKLTMVAGAETFIRGLGFTDVRVRHHGPIARIELPREEFARFQAPETAAAVSRRLKELGFTWVTLDLDGYQRGSMNLALPPANSTRSRAAGGR